MREGKRKRGREGERERKRKDERGREGERERDLRSINCMQPSSLSDSLIPISCLTFKK